VEEYDQRIRDQPEESAIGMLVLRDGKERRLTVHARSFPAERADSLAWQLIGVRLEPAGKALQIKAVRSASPADRIGIEPGDALVGLAGTETPDLKAFRRRLVEIRFTRAALLSIVRGRRLYHVTVPLTGLE
jgi:S1-C subfamily serine protease